ncbi:PepSY domain-containing protein [Streptomyces sp. NPDC049881]|uniref:PepSY-associated TM helix domain-containing protein n=1 Tax=Streptomyces sp. NPDC049881 TaxID=3155778 RepID=UPI0034316D8D
MTVTRNAPDTSGEGFQTSEGPARSQRSALKALVLRLHFYAGILVAPFLLVAAVSGLLYASSVQIERVVYGHELRVPVGEERLPLAEQVEAARAEHPEGTISGVRPGADADATTRVLLDVPGLGPSQRLAVFVDPYTAEVRGALEAYGSSGALPVRWWIDELHRNLHLGDFGRHYSELAASWLAVIALGGVVLWLGRRRTGKRTRRILVPERGLRGRRRLLGWHGTTGLWAALALCFLSVTGLTWSQHAGANIAELRQALSWETPGVTTTSAHHAPDGGDHAGDHGEDGAPPGPGVDAVFAAARDAGLGDQVEIVYPAEPGGPWTVQETRSQWPTGKDAVAVDGATAQVTDTVRFDDWPLAAKLAEWGIAAHMGLLFGLVNQLVLIALMIALITVILLGYRMWWLRRPTRAGAFTWGRPPRRGAWRRLSPAVLLPLVVATVAVGYYVPLLGLSLLGFLVADAALALLRRRRGEAAGSPSPTRR